MGANCDFLFLCEGEFSFLQNSLKDLLEKKDVSIQKYDFNLVRLNELEIFPKAFLIDAELLTRKVRERTFLYDFCIEHNLKIVILGDGDFINQALNGVSPRIIARTFARPINNQEVADQLKEMLEMAQYEDQKKKILVVDDSPVFLRTVAEWLDADYAVSVCPSATAAFHMIEVKRPDLILLDYEMPVCSGAQFLEMLHSEQTSADIPVIFLTSRSDRETVEEVVALKPQGYLLKTLPKEQILNLISEFFRS